MGYLLLEGGAEFGGGMRDPDLKAIELAGGQGGTLLLRAWKSAQRQQDIPAN